MPEATTGLGLDLNELMTSEDFERQRRVASMTLETAQLSQANLQAYIDERFQPLEVGTRVSLMARCALWQPAGPQRLPHKYLHATDSNGQSISPIPVQGDFWGLEIVESREIQPELSNGKAVPEECAYEPVEVCMVARDADARFARTLVALRHVQDYVALGV